MYKYYTLQAVIDGETEQLYGSYAKQDCTYEIEAERDSWKDQGYKRIKLVTTWVEDAPDMSIYTTDEV